MDLGIKGRTALVSGASAGLGRAIARSLALEGVKVIGVARRTDPIEELANEVSGLNGGTIVPLECDLSIEGAALDLADRAAALAPDGIDILANVAGASQPTTMEPDTRIWHAAYQLGFLAHVQLTFSLLPGMRTRGWGRVITVTGSSEPQFLSASTSPKAGLHVWSKAVSRDVAADGVTVNCIQPGRILSEQILRKFPSEDKRQAYAQREIPMRRFGDPQEFANAAVFLSSDAASYITGIVLPVDGGLRHFAH